MNFENTKNSNPSQKIISATTKFEFESQKPPKSFELVFGCMVRRQHVHGFSSESCDRRHAVIVAALEARGFSLHEISRAFQQHKQLGVYFDGVARVLRHDRLWRVHPALRCLLRIGGARPRVVRVLTGHLVHIFSLARPLLSALHRLYRFQAHPLDRWRKLFGLTWRNFVL